MSGNRQARPGTIFVCAACGKTSTWRYGFDDKDSGARVADRGWDESCMMHAALCMFPKVGEKWEAHVERGATFPDVERGAT